MVGHDRNWVVGGDYWDKDGALVVGVRRRGREGWVVRGRCREREREREFGVWC